MSRHYIFTLLLCLFTTFQIFAQGITTSSGIAIQGIARDENGEAKEGEVIAFSFKLYSTENDNIQTTTPSLETDQFGVFSHLLVIGDIPPETFAEQEVKLEIIADGVVVSDQAFNYVPYAVYAEESKNAVNSENSINSDSSLYANNGVPPGSVLLFYQAGQPTPEGWLPCDGTEVPVGVQYNALRTALGCTENGSCPTPDLNGKKLQLGGGGSPGQLTDRYIIKY